MRLIPEEIPIIFIMGPTATGKTDAAAFLNEHIPSELVSVDSSLVYRGMDIGTAKPDTDFLKRYPHHLVDIRNPDQTYSAADFSLDAKNLIQVITEKGRVPIFVGGTSFYFAAIEKGIPDLPAANAVMREEIDKEAVEKGWQHLYDELKKIDPRSAARIDMNDPQRIQRALEIVRLTGKPVEPLNSQPIVPNPIIKLGLSFSNRQYLHERIQLRFEKMVEAGLIQEIKGLLERFDKEQPAFRMIGYRQGVDYIDKKYDLNEFVQKSSAATRQLAKRQLTWMRNQSNLIWWVDDHSLSKKEYAGILHLLASTSALAKLS